MPHRGDNGSREARFLALPGTFAMTAPAPSTRDTAAALAEQHSRFLQFLRGRVGDPATAEDILQAAYVKAIECGAQLREAESSVAWFYRILRNAVADDYRREVARSRAMNQWAADWNEAWEPELKAEVCACILEAVRALKPEYRAAIEQVDLGEQSVESFAKAQRTTANNASVRLHRARKAVAKQITAICGTCAIHECLDCTCKR
jgi:RNA polymerase sigma factor (sigma-70 family)